GTGYYAIPLANAVAPSGKVFAIDLQREMLDLLQAKLDGSAAPNNIELRTGDAASTGLQDSSVDLVFIANVWHEVEDHAAVLREVRRILSHGGKLAILDWRPEMPSPPGPPQEHRIPLSDVQGVLSDHKWVAQPAELIGDFSY